MIKPRSYLRADAALTAAFNAVGGLTSLAAKLGRKPATLSRWRRCPAEHVLAVAVLSGVPRSVLRPDLYPPGGAETVPGATDPICEGRAV